MERKLTRRNILGAAGAFAGGSALAGSVAAAALPSSADAELFALLAEEDPLWEIVSGLQDEAQTRQQVIPQGRVEIRLQVIRGRVSPIYARTEEEVAQWFDHEPDASWHAELDRILDIRIDLYLGRRDELVSVIRERAAARAEALRAAGVDELEARAEPYIERASVISAKIDALTPKTIRGAIALLECDVPDRTEQAIVGLRDIVAGEARVERPGPQPARDARSRRAGPVHGDPPARGKESPLATAGLFCGPCTANVLR